MRKSHLIQTTQARVTEPFIGGTTSRIAASLVGVRRTVGFCFHRLRTEIAFEREAEREAMFEAAKASVPDALGRAYLELTGRLD